MSDDRTFPDRETPGADGSSRKLHYGEGVQPIDHIIAAGWGPEFCAGSILKYVRRTKDPEHSIESARWYHARLERMAKTGRRAQCVLGQLYLMLSDNEKVLLHD